MNRILTDDKIKALAVTIFHDSATDEIFACQSGSTLMKIDLKNANFQAIPSQTLIFLNGELDKDLCSNESEIFHVKIDLSHEDHRFVSLKPDSIRIYPGLSVFDVLESLPEISDKKQFPDRTEFDNLSLTLLQKHARGVKLIHDALECGDFGNVVPAYIKGPAYEKIFNLYKNRTGYRPVENGSIPPISRKEKKKKSAGKSPVNQRKQTNKNAEQILVRNTKRQKF